MKTLRMLTVVVTGLLACSIGQSGEHNKQLKIGDQAPSWKDLPGTDGKNHSLTELSRKDVVVVVFTCNSCPIAVGYEDRLLAFSKKYAGADGKVTLVAINVNKIPDDSMDKMKERAKEKAFTFPYLLDASQKIAREFGAEYTPEFFVLNKARQVVYMGAMDDRTKASDAKVNYLEAAVEATLKGQKCATAETLPRGCKIRFDREKR